jgi:hypothetical protein
MTDPYTASRDAARDALAAHFAAIDAASVARDAARKADAHAREANAEALKASGRAAVACLRSYNATVKFNAVCDARGAASEAQP